VTPDDNVLTWNNFLKTYQIPTVAAVTVDESLTSIKMPLASILCLLVLIPLGFIIKKRKKSARPIGVPLGLTAVLVAGSILLYPFFKIAVARPSVIAPDLSKQEAVAILESLLKNIYRSFDFR